MLHTSGQREAYNEIEPPSPGGMSRRLFLGTGIAGVLSSWLSTRAEAQETRRDINDCLKAIPNNLPHLTKRTEMLADDPAHGLIVIRQIHWAPHMTQRLAEEVEQCQKEIRDMLEALLKNNLIDDVYQEGRFAPNQPPPDPRYVRYASAEERHIRVDAIAQRGAANTLSDTMKLRY